MLPSHLRPGLPNGLFTWGPKTLQTSLPSSMRAACPAQLILLSVSWWRSTPPEMEGSYECIE
jgi:hypothetical protein